MIDELSSKIPDYFQRFEFFGTVLAKAIFDDIPMNLCMNRLMFRLILNPDADITLEDVKTFDTSVYNSLKYILDNEIDEDEYIELYFQHEFNGEMYPLIGGGNDVKVDDINKENYIMLKTDFMVKNFIYSQIEAIRKGFQKLIPLHYIKDFTDLDLQYLCCGEDEINLDDWKINTIYSGIYSEKHYVVQWFWNLMEELDQESLAIIFQFVTGMSRLPAGGFNSLNKNRGERQFFNIRSVSYSDHDPYPKAFTCFNRLHLPIYPSEEALQESFMYIIDQKEIYGFGLED